MIPTVTFKVNIIVTFNIDSKLTRKKYIFYLFLFK